MPREVDQDLSILTPGPSPHQDQIYGRTQHVDSYWEYDKVAALVALMRRCEIDQFEISEQEMDTLGADLPMLTMYRCPARNVVVVRAEFRRGDDA